MNRDSGAIHTSLRCLCLRLGAWIGLSESPTCLVCIFCSIIKLFPSSLKMRTSSYRPVSVQLFCSTSLSPCATFMPYIISQQVLKACGPSVQVPPLSTYFPLSFVVRLELLRLHCLTLPLWFAAVLLHLVQTHMLPVFLQKCDGTEPRVPTKQLCPHLYLSRRIKEALDGDNMALWLSF